MTLVALGDSIVHAENSWAARLARSMGEPLRRLSASGARSDDVLEQLPGLAGEQYAVACLSVGTNDVLFDWDAAGFADRFGRVVEAAGASAGRVVVATISLSLARFPGSGQELRRRVEEANITLRASGALVVAGEDLSGPRLLQPDRIHPTDEGQLLLADRAATALGVSPSPSSLAEAPADVDRWAYHRVAAGQAPRRVIKRFLGRPTYRDTQDD